MGQMSNIIPLTANWYLFKFPLAIAAVTKGFLTAINMGMNKPNRINSTVWSGTFPNQS